MSNGRNTNRHRAKGSNSIDQRKSVWEGRAMRPYLYEPVRKKLRLLTHVLGTFDVIALPDFGKQREKNSEHDHHRN